MPDFKGRKDFPEVPDDKIKIGDYSGANRLSVVDIYSPKGEPALRDRMMEPVKGESNTYDSPILSQQPVIVLSDTSTEEALINAIDGYVSKQSPAFDGSKLQKLPKFTAEQLTPKPKTEGGEVQKIIGDVLGAIPLVGGALESILEADDDEVGSTERQNKKGNEIVKSMDLEEGSRSWSYQG